MTDAYIYAFALDAREAAEYIYIFIDVLTLATTHYIHIRLNTCSHSIDRRTTHFHWSQSIARESGETSIMTDEIEGAYMYVRAYERVHT